MSMHRLWPARLPMRRPTKTCGIATAVFCAMCCLGDGTLVIQMAIAQDPPLNVAAETPEPPTSNPSKGPSAQPTTSSGKPPAAKKSLDELLERRGSLTLREGSLADWMLAIQKTWGVDILYDNDALQKEQFTGQLTDTPLKDILNGILPPKNYTYKKQGNMLLIVPLESWGDAVRPDQKLELIKMEFVNPSEVETTLRFLLSPHGKAQSIPSSKTLMVVDAPDNIIAIKEHVRSLEEGARRSVERAQQEERQQQSGPANAGPSVSSDPVMAQPVEQTITTVIQVKYVPADSLLEAVQTQIADGNVSTVADGNMLIVTGTESAVRSATQVLKQLDFPRKQVRITVLMYDIRVAALEQLGINWRHAGKARLSANGVPRDLFDLHSAPQSLGQTSSSSSGGSGSGSTPSTPSTPTPAGTTTTATSPGSFLTSAAPNLVGSALTLYHLSRYFDLSAVILALDQTDGARLLARPSVMCYDRKESEVKIISEIPVQQLTQTDQGGNIGTTTFREAGVTLKVIPMIGDDNQIMLTLAPEFSVLAGYQSGQPIIDRRQQTGTVVVRSGETLVLGGLRRRNELETVSGIPGLMNLKYVGILFRSHRTTMEESELVTFIHSEIVDDGYQGLLREQVASEVVNETLDRIPIAGHSPYTPPCNDPYCPIHNPRPKYWPGSMLHSDGNPIHHLPPGTPQYQSYEALPPVPGQPLKSVNPSKDPITTPAVPTSPTPTPMPPKPPMDDSPMDDSPTDDPATTTRRPPPVMIDETARRPGGSRLTMQRLPSVNGTRSLPPPPAFERVARAGFIPPTTAQPPARLSALPPAATVAQPPAETKPATQSHTELRKAPPRAGWKGLLR